MPVFLGTLGLVVVLAQHVGRHFESFLVNLIRVQLSRHIATQSLPYKQPQVNFEMSRNLLKNNLKPDFMATLNLPYNNPAAIPSPPHNKKLCISHQKLKQLNLPFSGSSTCPSSQSSRRGANSSRNGGGKEPGGWKMVPRIGLDTHRIS